MQSNFFPLRFILFLVDNVRFFYSDSLYFFIILQKFKLEMIIIQFNLFNIEKLFSLLPEIVGDEVFLY